MILVLMNQNDIDDTNNENYNHNNDVDDSNRHNYGNDNGSHNSDDFDNNSND